MIHLANPWLSALAGLGVTFAFLLLMIGWGTLLGALAPLVLRRPRAQWQLLRIDRFWLVNTILAPIMFVFFAAIAWILRLTPHQMGFNFDNLGLGLGVAIPVGLLLGIPSAIAAPIATRQGNSPMKVPFGRSLFDVIGAITYTALLVGPVEEIPFRGIIQVVLNSAIPQTALLGPFSAPLGTFIAALIFVAYHFRNVVLGGESVGQFLRLMPGRVIASLILSLLFQGTGSLVGPIVFHNLLDTCTVASLSIVLYRDRRKRLSRAAELAQQRSTLVPAQDLTLPPGDIVEL